ncbi:MAG: sel1 repeat family protein [Thermoguttaceae bacterium]|nr:sel1 repeat family protein [Thermoguttaceae bacterium]
MPILFGEVIIIPIGFIICAICWILRALAGDYNRESSSVDYLNSGNLGAGTGRFDAARAEYSKRQAALGLLLARYLGTPDDADEGTKILFSLEDAAPSEKLEWTIKFARRGGTVAIATLAVGYLTGDEALGVSKDEAEAIKWIDKLDAGKDDLAVLAALKTILTAIATGTGIASEGTIRSAMEACQKAFFQGAPMTSAWLIYVCADGINGFFKNEELAKKCLRLLEEDEDAPDFDRTTLRAFAHIRGAEEKWDEAIVWLRKAFERGSTVAAADLAVIYAEGKPGVEKDLAEEAKWLQILEDSKDAAAMSYYAWENKLAYIDWNRKAAELGDAEAMVRLAIAYSEGGNYPKARSGRELRESLANKEGSGALLAHMNDGGTFADETSVVYERLEIDEAEANKWFVKVAESGNARALDAIADFYASKNRHSFALHWRRLAADAGSRKAMRNLEATYLFGLNGVKADANEAMRWRKTMERAAKEVSEKASTSV